MTHHTRPRNRGCTHGRCFQPYDRHCNTCLMPLCKKHWKRHNFQVQLEERRARAARTPAGLY